jgi:hypothetical protein
MTREMPGRSFWIRSLVRVAFAALSLSFGVANAQFVSHPQPTNHSGPYDNTNNSLGGRYVGGGGTN